MAQRVVKTNRREMPRSMSLRKIRDMHTMAAEQGLLQGETEVVRGRMPKTLVSAAKKNTGIKSQTELIRLALETLANQDNYGAWLLSQRGTVPLDIDLEY
ncbi:MAG: hypothetical protein ACLGXA_19250 [Acidobacteriota bacterium]